MRFALTARGTYHYWATTTGSRMTRRGTVDSQLAGAIVVDPPGVVATDRIFVIGTWIDRGAPGNPGRKSQQLSVVNGKSWPYTERFTHVAGEPIHWRWINTSFMEHPMHFHGAYFRVTSEGDGTTDVTFPVDRQKLVATALMTVGGTNAFTLLPEREGRWLFHCHLLVHMSAEYRYLTPTPAGFLPSTEHFHGDSDSHGMAGLVLGLMVLPAAKAAAPAAIAGDARKLTLLVREKPATLRSPGATVFQMQEGIESPAIEAAAVPGPPIVLTQGAPVEITVVNQLREPTAVHWHGIELDSYFDGVPGWGGLDDRTTPQVDPGQAFTARFVPPRAGTFIYHTHWHNFLQLTGGLYGPLIVLPPGQKLDPETDKTVVIGLGGTDDINSPLLLNGRAQPDPLRLKAGAKSRLRFINITPNNPTLIVTLRTTAGPARWRAVAKDGADLPASQALESDAIQIISVGETYDFEFESATTQDLRLEVMRPFNRSLAVAEVQVR